MNGFVPHCTCSYNVSVVVLSSYSRGFHFTINYWQFIVVCYLVPGPTPCPEVVAVFYIRPAEVPTLFSVEGNAQVKQKNHECGLLTEIHLKCSWEYKQKLSTSLLNGSFTLVLTSPTQPLRTITREVCFSSPTFKEQECENGCLP